MSTEIIEYTETEKALAELRNKYAGVVFDVTKFKHMQEAKQARAELRTTRTTLEKMRVDIKAPALDRCRKIDSEAKRITGELLALEQPIDEQIKAEEQRKEREKAEADARAQAEREAVQARFDAAKGLPGRALGATTVEIEALIAEAEAMDGTFATDVLTSAFRFERDTALAALKDAAQRQFEAEQAAEAEAKRVASEREELARLRAEREAVQAEAERMAKEKAALIAEQERQREAAERAKREAVEFAERQAREAAEAAARQAHEAEERRIEAERAEARRIEDAERAAAAKKLQAEQEAAAAERARLDAEKKAQAKRERKYAIANATLREAATEAMHLLQSEGFADHLVTLKLAAALAREPNRKAA